jgi:hypothetical protein
MKKIIWLLFALPAIAFGQNGAARMREIGLNFSSLGDGGGFGIRYKQGPDRLVLRLTALSVRQSFDQASGAYAVSTKNKYIGMGTGMGFERRHRIDEKLTLYWGAETNLTYSSYNGDRSGANYYNNSHLGSIAVSVIGGAYYRMGVNFFIAAEINPGYNISRMTSQTGFVTAFTVTNDREYFSASNYASLTVAYRF